ncbi:MAG: N-acetyl-ornithine/N-acetyl-lysine deacetylase [Cenarchaeum symbiont of Oopsacas minuta]|nr:N-acetyl-ornithine/N-acetyl-lysine deacetylase [Cenarchaeum symbiont of Oopsacas minuta]
MFTDTDENLALKVLIHALGLYTPSLSEKPIADYLAGICSDLGFRDVHIDEVGNIIAVKGNGRPITMLCGHMDTVPGKILVKRDGDQIFGRGSSDAKAPLLAMLFAAACVGKNDGTIIFVGAVDEEGNATGIKNLASQKLDIDYAVFGEPSGIEKVTIAYKGRLAVTLRVNAKDSSHASAPWLSKNAIEEAAYFVKRIKESIENDSETRWNSITATLTEISGGTSHNVTPSECRATIDIRIPVGTSCGKIEEMVSNTVQSVSAERGVEAFHSILDETEPFEADHSSPLVRAFNLGAAQAGIGRISLTRKTGTGDMNVIGHRFNVPVVTYGPGDPHASHTANESVSASEYLQGITVLKCVLSHLKRLHDRRRN